MRYCILEDKGLIDYQVAWDYQQLLVTERLNNPELNDILILLEHPPVYTLGKGANEDFLKFDRSNSDCQVYRVERGGEVTYHCPNQLVVYPIINLSYYRQDLHWYLRQLEAVIIRVIANYGWEAYRIKGLTGVWLEGCKVAAVGIKVKRWITMHGLALNVCPDLTGFQRIIPCGIEDKPVGSLAQFIPNIDFDRLKLEVAEAFATIFQVKLIDKNYELLDYPSSCR
jgi:lipoyl(octanoyl) transferase